MAFLSVQSQIGLAKETTRNTAVNPSVWLPVLAPQVTPMQKWLRDEGMRGSPVLLYDQIAGTRHDEYDFKTNIFTDTVGNLFMGIFGTDTVTGSASTGYTHVLSLLNNASIGSQPASYTITDFDGANAFQIAGAQLMELTMTTIADGSAEISGKYAGQPYTVLTSGAWGALTPASANQNAFVAPWSAAVTLNGVAATYVAETEVKFDRKSTPIWTQGTQGPERVFAGPLEVSGRILCVLETANDPFSTTVGSQAPTALSRYQGALNLTLTDANDKAGTSASSQTLSVQCSNVQWHDVKRTRGKTYVEVEVQFEGHSNTSDAVGGGYSPAKVTLLNSQSATY